MDPTGERAVMEGIHRLPDEMLTWIFSHLSVHELGSASYVCQRWRSIVKSNTSLWKRHQVVFTGIDNIREVLLIVNAVPPLETLGLSIAQPFSVRIAWPGVYVRIPHVWEIRHTAFIAKTFEIEYSSGKDVSSYLSWVHLKTLKRLHLRKTGSCTSAGVGYGASIGELLRTRAHQQHRHLGRERNLEPVCDDFDGTNSVSYAPLPEQSWHRYLNAALGVIIGEASHDSEDAGGNRSSSQFAPCPDLEEVSVSCEIDRINLEMLCRLGPVRVLRLEKCTVAGLSFLPHCASRLEELVIEDCSALQEKELLNLSCLERLRVLNLSKWPFSLSVVRTYTECLPHLESLEVTCS